MRKIHAFDFDGTLTSKDTFVEFIRFAKGDLKCFLGFLLFSPILALMKLGYFPNGKAKQLLFTFFFKGDAYIEFEEYCYQFGINRRQLLRPAAVEALKKALAEGDEVVIVSASPDAWVKEFFDETHVKVIGTQLERVEGILTGRFKSANCYGQEKVNRFLAAYPDRTSYHLVAYGDSRGDRELLALADVAHYKPFR